MMDKARIASGVVRIGFVEPELDVVISCNPRELKVFIDTIEAVKDLPTKYCELERKIICTCLCNPSIRFQTVICQKCIIQVVRSLPSVDDVSKILDSWLLNHYTYIIWHLLQFQ